MRGVMAGLAALSIAACGGESSDARPEQQQPPAQAPSQPVGPSVVMYKSRGGVQCQSTGSTLAALETELTAAGIQVLSSSCGHDGFGRIALCGSGDGGIGIFELPQAQQSAAQAAGFSLMSALPDAIKTPC